MMALQEIRQGLAAARRLSAVSAAAQAKIITREFNQQTLDNTYKYLVDNQDSISFERNESGFIRTTLPDEVLQPDAAVAPLAAGERLRINFWYDDKCGMGDESIHDHPNAFQSFIVNGGYEHELYRVTSAKDPKKFLPSMTLQSEELWELYQRFIKNNMEGIADKDAMSQKFKFSIDKATKTVSYEGPVGLRLTGVETTKAGDTVHIDSQMIHRVSKFQAVPGEKTLSLNVVRESGKGKTNIYLPERKDASVKIEREKVSKQDAALAAKEMTALFARARKELITTHEATMNTLAKAPK